MNHHAERALRPLVIFRKVCLGSRSRAGSEDMANFLKFYEMEGLRAVPVQVDIKVVPVQDEKGSIEKMDAPDSPALEFKPEVNQG